MSPVTKAGRSSSQLIAIVQRRDSILPEPPLSPLVPDPLPPSNETLMAFFEWAAFSDESIEARDAKRLMEALRLAAWKLTSRRISILMNLRALQIATS